MEGDKCAHPHYVAEGLPVIAITRFLRLPFRQSHRRDAIGMIDPKTALLTPHTFGHKAYSFHILALSFLHKGKIIHAGQRGRGGLLQASPESLSLAQ